MITRSKPFRFLSLRALRNTGTRMFVTGSDPIFGRNSGRRLQPTLPPWSPNLLDRLTPQLTRHHE